MKKVQQQRWERQQRDQINRAREQAWKNTLSVGLSPQVRLNFVKLTLDFFRFKC